jgi:hypothetical protein
MSVADIAVAALGFTTAFASTVWVIIGWSSYKAKHWGQVSAYSTLIIANAFSTVVLVALLVRRPFNLPPGSSTLILLPLIGLPPTMSLRSWLVARSLMGRSGEDA